MKNKRSFINTIQWIAIILLIIGGVIAIRQYGTGSYRVSTDAMMNALTKGDFILVNKLPLANNPARNKIVLFNSPLQNDRAASPMFLSRCIGMPGDTIIVTNEGYEINGQSLPFSPKALTVYLIDKINAPAVLKIMQQEEIPVRNWKEEADDYSFSITPFEAFAIQEEMPDSIRQLIRRKKTETYRLVVPKKDRAHRIDADALTACKEAIINEAGDKADFREGKLYMDGVETNFFFFNQDYYWMLSDNTDESVDSRHLGFIPRDHLIGSVWFCWFSNDLQRIFKPVN